MSNQYLNSSINLGKKQISVFVNDIVSVNATKVVLPILVKGTIRLISGAASIIPMGGPLKYTVEHIHDNVSVPVAGSEITIPQVGSILGRSVTVPVTVPVVPGDSLVITVGGTQTGSGTGDVAFLIS